jgi:hypothetical protein
MLIQELAQQATGTPSQALLSVVSLSSIVVLITGGIAWGKMDNRVKALEDSDFICREEFNLLRDAINSIRDDVREIRRRLP